ncbi:MAG: hypothetical protein ACQKBY_00955 [Verrucomicrobiales bacterium]
MDEVLAQLLPAVEEQLASPDTPYVAETYQRLLTHDDIDAEEAKNLIAFCLADELEALEREERPFNAERYQTLLSLLPTMPEGR